MRCDRQRDTLIYRFDPDRSISFSVQRGFRAGGSFVSADPGGAIVGKSVIACARGPIATA